MAIARRGKATTDQSNGGCEPGRWGEAHPKIFEYLTSVAYANGDKRQTSTLNVFVEDGRWKVALHDRDQRETLWMTALSLEEAFDGVELALAEDVPGAWRAWKGEEAKDRRTRK